MITFFTLPIEFLTHEPETIVSFITATRPFLNCSIVPTILSDSRTSFLPTTVHESIWEKLAFDDLNLKWYLLFSLSDTLQFASSMHIPDNSNATLFAQRIIHSNPYFTRTLKHFSTSLQGSGLSLIASLLRQVRSLESVSLCSADAETLSHLKFLPLRKYSVLFDNKNESPEKLCDILSCSESVMKNTLEEFVSSSCVLSNLGLVSSFPNLRRLMLNNFFNKPTLDIAPISSLKKLQALDLVHSSLIVTGASRNDSHKQQHFESVEECLSELTQLRSLKLRPVNASFTSLSFLEAMPHLQELDVCLKSIVEGSSDEQLEREMTHVHNLVNLRSLNLAFYSFNVTHTQCDIIFEGFAAECHCLEQLVVDDAIFTSRGVEALKKLAPSLRGLTIDNPKIYDDQQSINQLDFLLAFENLEGLIFGGSTVTTKTRLQKPRKMMTMMMMIVLGRWRGN